MLLASVALIQSYSQDIITKNDGTEIKAKVQEILSTEIKYKKFDNIVSSISKCDLFRSNK